MTAHLVMPQGHADDAFLKSATEQLHERFDIEHVTIQVVRVPFTPGCATLASSGAATTDTAPAVHGHPHGR